MTTTQDSDYINPEEDTLWKHKWGFADTQFVVNSDHSVTLTGNRYELCGLKLPYFLSYIEDCFDVNIDWNTPRKETQNKPVPSPRRNDAFCETIAQNFPARCYSDDPQDRLRHSHGQAMTEEIWEVLYGKLNRCVDMVFYCESETDAQILIQLAIQHNVCLIPYGGGTCVSGNLIVPLHEHRMVVAIDTRRMNQIEWIDIKNGRASVQAGITGKDLENALRQVGFTSGHEPDSRELSTLGGWIATNASGMKKNRYGNIEDIVETVTLISPMGIISQHSPYPRTSMGMSLQNLLFGSEGNLGLIVKATIRIRPLPESQQYGSLVFPNFEQGVAFLRELSKTNFIPASIRLVDNAQFNFSRTLKPKSVGLDIWSEQFKKFYLTKVLGFSLQNIVAATLVMEGSRQEVNYQAKNIYVLAKRFSGVSGGSESGRRGYRLTYAIAYIAQFLMAFDIFGESFETTVPWTSIQTVCQEVTEELKRQHQQFKLPGKPFLSYRVTQIYHTGVCIYFTLGLYMKGVDNPRIVFGQIYKALRQKIMARGGSISHHHGVGKIRKDLMGDIVSPATIELLRKVKETSDPLNIFGISNNLCGLD